jgi:membrane-bound serine protease (ClpP class)
MNIWKNIVLWWVSIWILLAPAWAADNTKSGVVYVIPIKGMIEPALLYVIRRGVMEAESSHAKAVIFTMDTPGGTLQAARDIVNLIEKIDVPTYTYVEEEAFSAGAIIAMATQHIYMAPGSVIGDAMPIMMSPMGGATEMPDDIQEKSVSAVAALIRSAAEQNGHDKELAEAMVRRENEYKIGDDIICPAGELLTLTNEEAARLVGEDQRPLLSKGTLSDLDALLEQIGYADATVKTLEITGAEKLGRLIQVMSVFFLGAGLLGLYIEMQSPGVGIPGLIGVVCLAIFFYGHHVAGLAGSEEVLLVLLGIGLLAVELFVLPGFGVAGIAGICLILVGLLLAMVEQAPSGPWIPTWPSWQLPLRNLAFALLFSLGAAAALSRYLPRARWLSGLRLEAATHAAAGYTSSHDVGLSVGDVGIALSALRPSGAAQFGDRRLDVVSEGEFIPKDVSIRVTQVRGNRIVVEESA